MRSNSANLKELTTNEYNYYKNSSKLNLNLHTPKKSLNKITEQIKYSKEKNYANFSKTKETVSNTKSKNKKNLQITPIEEKETTTDRKVNLKFVERVGRPTKLERRQTDKLMGRN